MNIMFSKVVIVICIILNILFWITFGWYVDNEYNSKDDDKTKKVLKINIIICDIMLLINTINLIIFLVNV